MNSAMQFVDTHCHIHFPDYQLDADEVRERARKDGVTSLLCVGCTLRDSRLAVGYAARHDGVWASIGLHPHEAKVYVDDHRALQQFHDLAGKAGVVAIGETGLDYYYEHSPRDIQQKMLKFQLDIAVQYGLPVIFHVRDAFADFWPIFDSYTGLTGVIHSFTATEVELAQIMQRNLYVGLNGIVTFSKNEEQLAAVKKIPLQRLLLETDAPYLTPVPFRGTICEPKHVRVTAEFLADLRGERLEVLVSATTQNAVDLFKLL